MLAADRSLELARRDMESGRLLQAIAHYQAGRARGLSADIWYARSLAAVAPQQALQAAVRAIPGEDAQNAHYTIAWIYARTGDVPHTEQALRATLACAPNWFKPHWMLAQILQRQGRTAEASAEAARAAYLDAGKNPEVAQTAQAMGALVRGR
jgi:tetratricopeptide (TPR) repeat protein